MVADLTWSDGPELTRGFVLCERSSYIGDMRLLNLMKLTAAIVGFALLFAGLTLDDPPSWRGTAGTWLLLGATAVETWQISHRKKHS
jgi:hypothetical protein